MDVQKYIKRLKFARADWSRNSGEFDSRQSAIDFLDNREFVFGDPFVVKYTEDGQKRLLLAIGKADNPTVTPETTEVTGGIGEYELIDAGSIRDELEKLKQDVSANTEAIEELNDALDTLAKWVEEISGSTDNLAEIVGTGFTEGVDITERIKRDEELAGIKWGHDEGEPMDGRLDPAADEIPGDSIMEKLVAVRDASAIMDTALNTRCDSIQDQLNDEKGYRKAIKLVEISHDKFESLGLGSDVRDAYFVTYHKPQSTEPYEDPQPGDAIIKVYKDSVIYKIYLGHMDDQITSPTDPTVIPGTGETALCFIYFNEKGEYALSANDFDLGDAFNELRDEFDVFTAQTESNFENVENEIAAGLAGANLRMNDIQGQLNDEKGYRKAIKLVQIDPNKFEELGIGIDIKDAFFVTSHKPQSTEPYEDPQPGDAIVKVFRDKEIALAEETRHITLTTAYTEDGKVRYEFGEYHISSTTDLENERNARTFADTQLQNQLNDEKGYRKSIKIRQLTAAQVTELFGANTNVLEAYKLIDHNGDVVDSDVVKVYKDAVSLNDMDSFELTYDPNVQEILLNWTSGGNNRSTHIDVSDFVKDSFLEGVQVVTRDGVQYLEFRFKTYEGEPVPIYIPFSDLATIYHAGDGIDAEEFDNNQIIKVKIDPMHEGENSWLTLEPNGLRVTGLTEYIDEKLENLDSYVRKDEVEDHLDSASTLPVQNQVITNALDDLNDSINERFDEITNVISGVTGETLSEYVRKDEVDDELSLESENPVQNKVIAQTILDNEEVVAAALNDLNDRKADRTELEEAVAELEATDLDLQTQIDNLTSGGLTGVTTTGSGNVVTAIEKDGQNVKATLGEIDLSDCMSKSGFTAYTASTAQHFETQELVADSVTATTITADDYNNLPTATTEGDFGVVTVDPDLDENSPNPVANSAVTKVILEDEEVIAAAFNDLNDRKADKSYVDEAVQNVHIDVDDAFDTGSTNPVENRVIAQYILENEEIVAAALNDLNDRKADEADVDALDARVGVVEEAVATLAGGGLTGVTTTGSGNVVTSVEKDGLNVKVTKGNVDVSNKLDTSVFTAYTGTTETAINNKVDKSTFSAYTGNTQTILNSKVDNNTFTGYTAATETVINAKADKSYVDTNFVHSAEYYSSGSTHEIRFKDASGNTLSTVNANDFIKDGMVDSVGIVGSNLVITFNSDSGKQAIAIPLADIFDPSNYYDKTAVDNLLDGKSDTGHTHTLSEITDYTVDSALDTASTNPVQNKVITQVIIDNELVTAAALNDLNDRKANIEDVPTSVTQLDGYNNLATKSDLDGYLPLSGGTMTGNISGSTGNAIYMPGGFFQQSDERSKIFIGDIENALEKANEVPTKYFYWKSMPDGPKNLGTSAQKVKEMFPEIVAGDEVMSVDYSKLSIVALAAIKELTAKVEELEKEIAKLKGE